MIATKWLRETSRKARPRTRFGLGVVLAVVLLLVSVGLYFKPEIETLLRSGETITAEFDRNYKLTVNESRVLFAGLDVGVVSGIDTTDDGTTRVSMKVDQTALDELGPEPSARIVPNTVLSGVFGVQLTQGGGPGRFTDLVIPKDRTGTPVELDRILESLPTPTRDSLRNVVGHLDDTLSAGGADALRDLASDAPRALGPASSVLEAAQGTRPGVDLPQLVTDLNATADVLTRRQGQLAGIVTSLQDTTAVLAQQTPALAAGLETLPAALRDTRAGVTDLRGTLDRLTATAPTLQPAAIQLDSMLSQLNPVLTRARPLLSDLRPLLHDVRPVVDELVPTAERGSEVLGNVSGPVLDRLNGPITQTVMNPWRGTGPYAGNGGGFQADHKFYEELGYLAANADRGSMYQDANGSMLGFQVGFNLSTPAPAIDAPLTLPDLVRRIQQVSGGGR